MRIGEASTQLGLATHVLRHWEDEGVVVPDRSNAGHRDYDAEAVARLQIVRRCQETGMSLAQISALMNSGPKLRRTVIVEHQAKVAEQQVALLLTQRFLQHVLTCRHELVTRCPDCSEYAAGTESFARS